MTAVCTKEVGFLQTLYLAYPVKENISTVLDKLFQNRSIAFD